MLLHTLFMTSKFKKSSSCNLLYLKLAYPLGAHGVETDHSHQDSVCKATKYERHAPPFSKNGRSLKFVTTLLAPRLSSARSIHSQSVKTEHLLLQNEFILVRNNNHDHLVLF